MTTSISMWDRLDDLEPVLEALERGATLRDILNELNLPSTRKLRQELSEVLPSLGWCRVSSRRWKKASRVTARGAEEHERDRDRALVLVQGGGVWTRQRLAGSLGVNVNQAAYTLRLLEDEGHLIRLGDCKGTIYVAKEQHQ